MSNLPADLAGTDPPATHTHMLGKIGLAAVILLAPGGFVLGASLAAHHLAKRRAARADRSEDVQNDAD